MNVSPVIPAGSLRVDLIRVKSVPVAASRQTLGRRLVPNARRTRMPITVGHRAAIVQSIPHLIRAPPIPNNARPPIVLPERSVSVLNALAVMPGRTLREGTRGPVSSVSLASKPTSKPIELCFKAIVSTQALSP
jgi:hypothetical protein